MFLNILRDESGDGYTLELVDKDASGVLRNKISMKGVPRVGLLILTELIDTVLERDILPGEGCTLHSNATAICVRQGSSEPYYRKKAL